MVDLLFEEYEAMVTLAIDACRRSPEAAVRFSELVAKVNQRNDLSFRTLWVQWTERGQPLPLDANFPVRWPDAWRYRLDLFNRTPTRKDVEEILARHATRPVDVLVTYDPAALVGWSQLDRLFVGQS